MKKKKNKSGSKKKNFLKRWNDWETVDRSGSKPKYYPVRAAAKTGVDLIGVTAGGTIGAVGGIWTPFVGLALLAGGHLLGDKSGILRVVGASMMAYGIAKAQENRAASEAGSVNGLGSLSGAKDRLLDFKDNFLKAFYLDKLTKKKEDPAAIDETTMGAIDLSALDAFEDLTKQSAYNFELKRVLEEGETEDDFEEEDIFEEDEIYEDDLEGLDYTIIDEGVDFATI